MMQAELRRTIVPLRPPSSPHERLLGGTRETRGTFRAGHWHPCPCRKSKIIVYSLLYTACAALYTACVLLYTAYIALYTAYIALYTACILLYTECVRLNTAFVLLYKACL